MLKSALPVLLLLAPLALASPVRYSDYQSWLNAVEGMPNMATVTETFAGNQLNTTGLSVDSFVSFQGETGPANSRIENNAWSETTQKYQQTVWTYGQALYGFGGYFDLPAYGAGLDLFPDSGGVVSIPSPDPSFDGFVGFVSDVPFSSVLVAWGDFESSCACYTQTYSLRDLSLAFDPPPGSLAPEPAAFWLVGLPLALLGLSVHRRTRR